MFRMLFFIAVFLGLGAVHLSAGDDDDSPRPPAAAPDAAERRVMQQTERKAEQIEREIAELAEVSQWYAHAATRIDSPEFPAAVEKMWTNTPLMIPRGATPIALDSLTVEEKRDLDLAIGGLMQAYASPGPDSNIAYFASRGETLDPDFRDLFDRFRKRKDAAAASLKGLSDRDFLLRYWQEAKLKNVWAGFVPESSHLAIWDGKTVSSGDPRKFHILSGKGGLPASADEALTANGQLMRTIRHIFTPRRGMLSDALMAEISVPVCEVKLVIEFDPEWSKSRAVYLCRFWLNRTEEKWQPLTLHCFVDSRVSKPFPSPLF